MKLTSRASWLRAIFLFLFGAYAIDFAWAEGGPEILGKQLYSNETNYLGLAAPDDKTRTLLFDDLGVKVLPHRDAPPIAIRNVPLKIGVDNAAAGAKLGFSARGDSQCSGGAKCLLIFWVEGRTIVCDLSTDPPGSFFRHVDFALPAANHYQARIILIAEREAKRADLEPSIAISALDATIAPPPAEPPQH